MIRKLITYYWDLQLHKIERIEKYNGSPFRKVHQKFLDKHKNTPVGKSLEAIKEFFRNKK